jgi:hypothetical protein
MIVRAARPTGARRADARRHPDRIVGQLGIDIGTAPT